MRTIKFRSKRSDGVWVYGTNVYIPIKDKWKTRINGSRVDPSTVGQFTGLLDRNGKEIYEGDVVEIISYYTSPREKEMSRTRAVIMFDKTLACFLGKSKSASFAMTCASNMEVVGNIHEQSKS